MLLPYTQCTAAQQGNFGRFKSPEATAALKAYANAKTDADRAAPLATLQKIFVEQAPMLPVGADNVGGAYSTKNWVGWPSDADPYAPSQPTQSAVSTGNRDRMLPISPAERARTSRPIRASRTAYPQRIQGSTVE